MLAGKVAVITGAGKGIGEAAAKLMAAQGAAVVVCDLDAAAAKAVVKQIQGAGGRAVAVAADVTRPDAPATVVKAAVDSFGGIDILVNNAGERSNLQQRRQCTRREGSLPAPCAPRSQSLPCPTRVRRVHLGRRRAEDDAGAVGHHAAGERAPQRASLLTSAIGPCALSSLLRQGTLVTVRWPGGAGALHGALSVHPGRRALHAGGGQEGARGDGAGLHSAHHQHLLHHGHTRERRPGQLRHSQGGRGGPHQEHRQGEQRSVCAQPGAGTGCRAPAGLQGTLLHT